MTFYTKQQLDNLLLLQQTEQAMEEGLVSAENAQAIRKELGASLYAPNLFIRIGLFILTNLAAAFAMGSISAFLFSTLLNENNYHVLGYFMGLISIGALEMLLRANKYYRAGVDDGLSWMACSFLGLGISPLMEKHPIVFFGILFLILFIASIRYLNEVLAIGAVITLFFLTYHIAAAQGGKSLDFLPFIFFTLAILLVFLVERIRYRLDLRHWDYWHRAVHAISLLLVYASINYYAVREGSILLLHKKLLPEQQIPLGGFFWFLTFLIPVFFVVSGLRKKQPIKYRIGLLTLAISFITLRNYYHFTALEIILSITGAGLLVIGYFLVRYFKENMHGYSYHPGSTTSELNLANLEALVIGEGMGGSGQPSSGKEFGGGSSGGAGASGRF